MWYLCPHVSMYFLNTWGPSISCLHLPSWDACLGCAVGHSPLLEKPKFFPESISLSFSYPLLSLMQNFRMKLVFISLLLSSRNSLFCERIPRTQKTYTKSRTDFGFLSRARPRVLRLPNLPQDDLRWRERRNSFTSWGFHLSPSHQHH